jgi:phage terminase large subunit
MPVGDNLIKVGVSSVYGLGPKEPVALAPVLSNPVQNDIDFARKFQGLFRPHRYKVRWGGRGGAKSWSVARALVLLSHSHRLRILCVRELQNSIKDSVHRLLKDQIDMMGLSPWFYITQQSIVSLVTGSEFIFKGLRHNINEIKSTEGIDICWVEEAQLVSADSWELLIPTIRKEGSEIWITFNAIDEEDATYQRFVVHTPPNCDIEKVNWDDNPWFPDVLDAERKYMLSVDPLAYEHVWGGACRRMGDSVIFKGKFVIEGFPTPVDPVPSFKQGNDYGFAGSPNAFIRFWTTGSFPEEHLWVDEEIYGYGVEIDDVPKLLSKEPESGVGCFKTYPIKADAARPEMTSFLRRQGFVISSADKWAGSVEDGIAHMRMFKMIHIHERCKRLAEEFRLYSWKIDKKMAEAAKMYNWDAEKLRAAILPEPVDAFNHGIDAIRYGLDGYIQHRGGLGVWGKLAK